MHFDILPTDQIDRDAHYTLILESLENSPFKNMQQVEEVIERHLQKIMSNPKINLMVVAKDDKTRDLLGQLLVGLGFGGIGLIQPWQPIVHPDSDKDKVALALIEHSKKIIESHQRTKMEIWMELANDHLKSMHLTYKKWYEQCGFQLSSDEYNMETKYSEIKAIEYTIPEGFEVIPMINVPIEELRDIVFEVFKNSKDQWVNNLSDDEIKKVIKSWMKVAESFHPKASLVLKNDGKIIGFNGMEVRKNSVEIGPLGILPSYRGRGLGRILILESIKRLDSDIKDSIILSVSTKNNPAIKVYSDLGFKTQFQTLIYSWTPNQGKK